ncbi:MAG: hypothetical protein IT280_12840 [Ignavibacteria bacterium]|nr:hypothetical protein [Ignavibacteria bacterium]
MKSSLNNPVEIPSRSKGTGSESGNEVTINADDCVIGIIVNSTPMTFTLINNKINTDSIIHLTVNNLAGAKLIANLRNSPEAGSVGITLESDNDTMGGAFGGGEYQINVSIF